MTDDDVLASVDWVSVAGQVLEAGGDALALHLRGSKIGPRRLLELADTLLPVARGAGSTLVVNDRVDIALVADLDGVHLGRASLPPGPTRQLVGPDRWIGVSCHRPTEVEAAVDHGADYVFLGTMYRTESHPGREGVGPGALAAAIGSAKGVPLIGIGGVGPPEAASLSASGAHGVAAIRGIWSAPDPTAAVTHYLEVLGD